MNGAGVAGPGPAGLGERWPDGPEPQDWQHTGDQQRDARARRERRPAGRTHPRIARRPSAASITPSAIRRNEGGPAGVVEQPWVDRSTAARRSTGVRTGQATVTGLSGIGAGAGVGGDSAVGARAAIGARVAGAEAEVQGHPLGRAVCTDARWLDGGDDDGVVPDEEGGATVPDRGREHAAVASPDGEGEQSGERRVDVVQVDPAVGLDELPASAGIPARGRSRRQYPPAAGPRGMMLPLSTMVASMSSSGAR